MEKFKINFLLAGRPKPEKQNKLLLIGKIVIVSSLILFLFLGIFTYRLIASKNGPEATFRENLAAEIKIISDLKYLILGSEKLLKGEREDRVNILILGVGGQYHDGPNLSDTIIIASIQPSVPKVAFLSIPRDLYVPIPDRGWRKINDANALGDAQNRGQGPILAAETISQVFDLPIHYYIKIDFSGFKKAIDDLGGVDVYVERSFTDSSYPTNNDLYQTVSFRSGWQKMDGDTALKYARSRHGNNGEGSDFARGLRQQKIIEAVKDKVFSVSFILNPAKISTILEDLGEHIKTDLEIWQMIKLAKLTKDTQKENITNKILDNGADGPLYSNTENGAYVLLPKKGDFSELRAIARGLLSINKKLGLPAALGPQKPKIAIEIQNGTKINGLAANYAVEIEKNDFNIIHIGNASRQDYSQTAIYDLTGGNEIENLEKIKKFLKQKNRIEKIDVFSLAANSPIVSSLNLNRKADFVIILGQNAANNLTNVN